LAEHPKACGSTVSERGDGESIVPSLLGQTTGDLLDGRGWSHDADRQIVGAEFIVTRTRFFDVLEASKAAGHLAPDTDAQAAAIALFGMMPGFVLQRLVLQDVDPESYSGGLRALMDGAIPRVLSTQT